MAIFNTMLHLATLVEKDLRENEWVNVSASGTCPGCGSVLYSGTRFCAQCGRDASDEQVLVTTTHGPPSITSITAVAEAEMLDALRDATLGDYDIQGELGRGGMAIVYRAHAAGTGRRRTVADAGRVMKAAAREGRVGVPARTRWY